MKILTMTNFDEISGGSNQAILLAKYLASPLMHYLPTNTDELPKTSIDNVLAFYPSKSLFMSIAKLNPDILLVHTPSTNLVGEVNNIKKICKIVYVCHANIFEFLLSDSQRVYLPYLIKLLDESDVVVSVSDKQRKLLSKLTKNKIVVIPPAIEYNKLKNVESYPRKYELIMAGRVEPFKNHLIPILAMKEVIKKYRNAFLKIFGFGNLMNLYNQLISAYELNDNIALYGHIKHDELITEMCYSSALLISSFDENASVVELEAKALGIPVLNVNPFDVGSCASVIKDLFKNYDKYKEKADVIRSSDELASHDVSVVSNAYKKLFKELLIEEVI